MRASLLCLLVAVAYAAAISISGSASLDSGGAAAQGSLQLLNPFAALLRPPGRRQGPGHHGGHRPGPPGPPGRGGPGRHHPGPPHDRRPEGHHSHHQHRPPFPHHPHRPRPPCRTSTTTDSGTSVTTPSTTSTSSTTTEGTTSSTTTEGTTSSTTESTTSSTTESTTASTTDSTTASTTDSTTASTTDSTTASTTESTTASTTDSTTASTASTTDSTTTSTTEGTTTVGGRRRRDISFSFSKRFPNILGSNRQPPNETAGIRNRQGNESTDEPETTSQTESENETTAGSSSDPESQSTTEPANEHDHDSGSHNRPRRPFRLPRFSLHCKRRFRRTPGMSDVFDHARHHLMDTLQAGHDIDSGIHEAMSRAMVSSDPVGALNALAATALDVYEIAAEHCPLMIVARCLREEGRNIAATIREAAANFDASGGSSLGDQ